MNSNPEAIDAFLAWLLQDPRQTGAAPSGETSSYRTGPDEFGITDLQSHDLDVLNVGDGGISASAYELSDFPFSESSLLETGDIPAVQDRFYTLLKRRLRAEIERKPPLFPWETDVYDYNSETPDWATSELVPGKFWTTQLQSLNLPVPMPEALLVNLFDQCQAVVQLSLREGAKLVQAVESLFPGQSTALNQLAGYVLASPARSGASPIAPSRLSADFPSRYEAATPAQQMALSLIAAREILESLTLKLSPTQPQVERQWQTEAGLLRLVTEYQSQPVHRLRVQGELPCGGSIQFQHQDAQATAQRSTPGYVSVELFNPEPNRVYPLEVRLNGNDQPSVVFAIESV